MKTLYGEDLDRNFNPRITEGNKAQDYSKKNLGSIYVTDEHKIELDKVYNELCRDLEKIIGESEVFSKNKLF